MSYSLVLALALVGVLAPSASAGGKNGGGKPGTKDRFTCRASAVRLTSPLLNLEPVVANSPGDPCRDDSAQLLNVPIPGLLTAGVANARTDVEQDRATANASLADATITLGGTVITATVLESEAKVVCNRKTGKPEFSGSSRIVALTINGQPVTVTGQPNQTISLGPLTIVINEQIQTGDTLTVRALRVSLALPAPVGTTTLVVAESIVDVHGKPCAKKPPKKPQCSDGKDNDGDKKIDYRKKGGDPQCKSPKDDNESK